MYASFLKSRSLHSLHAWPVIKNKTEPTSATIHTTILSSDKLCNIGILMTFKVRRKMNTVRRKALKHSLGAKLSV